MCYITEMSIDRCRWCSNLVDTDAEPEAYVEWPTYTSMAQPVNPTLKEPTETLCLCHVCREAFERQYGELE